MMKQKRGLRVFLGYSSHDSAHAKKLRDSLSAHPEVATLWTDKSISAGEAWQARLRSELTKADVFVVLLSPDSVKSSWVLTELGAAWADGIPIVAITTTAGLAEKLPLHLEQTRIIHVDELEEPEAIYKVLRCFEESVA